MTNDEARELSLPPVVEGGGERARDWLAGLLEASGTEHDLARAKMLWRRADGESPLFQAHDVITALDAYATEREAAARAAGIAEGMERAAGIADLHAGSWKWLARKAKEDVEYPQYECSMPLSEECQDIATAIRAAILQGTGEGSGDA